MILFYNISIRIYIFLIRVASLFNEKARQWVQGRRDIFKRIEAAVQEGDRIAWFHAASLGEFEQGRPVIEAMREQTPDLKILLTFFSPSGFEIRKDYEGADYVFYLPADTRRNARKFLDLVQPEVVFFIKYEFWHHYLKGLRKRNIPTYLFSSIFRENQTFFKFYGGFYRKMLLAFSHLFVQTEKSAELLKSIGLTNVSVAGDTRFDRVFTIAHQAKVLPLAEKFKQNQPLLIAGSTWPKDEENLLSYINSSKEERKYIIAPHEVDEDHIQRILEGLDKKVVRYTQANEENVVDAEVLVVDCIGVLSSMYRYGEVAYIGGGFGKGIHNTLEAATFGMPIIFGPNYYKFQEAKDLIQLKGAFSYTQTKDLHQLLDSFWQDASTLKNAGKAARSYVESQRGATYKILKEALR
jgi:3-deoxy-D-manno-octulosonic-acid transferase